MRLIDASILAWNVGTKLEPYCERIQTAGSVRRNKTEVKDIEILAIPKMVDDYDLFGNLVGQHSRLNDRSIFKPLGMIVKGGERYIQVALNDGINLDLFIVMPPAQWGVLMAIRTGPADFSKWLVTNRSKGGALHNGWRCVDGRICDAYGELDFQDESKFLEWLELGWIEPDKREAQWGKFKKDYRD